ncbi:hypothetical protein FKX85_20435 [Echinicola soli]|uniref:Uncharacterized protein n=1 Tax=Echinicola soli TaxID=2591634 RepID=A0A514CNA4_9BACT|nr:hypothetical protein [Echinicola soli]QDH81270.1 hypothetical protein FKX85_20435 [Echinicola soli]
MSVSSSNSELMLYQALLQGFKDRKGHFPVGEEKKDLKLLSTILVGPKQSLLREIPKCYRTISNACGPPKIELSLINGMDGSSQRAGVFAFSLHHFYACQETDRQHVKLEVIALKHPKEQLPLILLQKPETVFWRSFQELCMENF